MVFRAADEDGNVNDRQDIYYPLAGNDARAILLARYKRISRGEKGGDAVDHLLDNDNVPETQSGRG
jgi:hypothetical protein